MRVNGEKTMEAAAWILATKKTQNPKPNDVWWMVVMDVRLGPSATLGGPMFYIV
jgi:hypothetical protein